MKQDIIEIELPEELFVGNENANLKDRLSNSTFCLFTTPTFWLEKDNKEIDLTSFAKAITFILNIIFFPITLILIVFRYIKTREIHYNSGPLTIGSSILMNFTTTGGPITLKNDGSIYIGGNKI